VRPLVRFLQLDERRPPLTELRAKRLMPLPAQLVDPALHGSSGSSFAIRWGAAGAADTRSSAIKYPHGQLTRFSPGSLKNYIVGVLGTIGKVHANPNETFLGSDSGKRLVRLEGKHLKRGNRSSDEGKVKIKLGIETMLRTSSANQNQRGNRKHFIPVGILVHRAGAHQGNSPTREFGNGSGGSTTLSKKCRQSRSSRAGSTLAACSRFLCLFQGAALGDGLTQDFAEIPLGRSGSSLPISLAAPAPPRSAGRHAGL